MLRAFLFVGLRGATGSMVRYAVGLAVGRYLPAPYPLATFVINVVGCLFIGLLSGWSVRNQWLQEGGLLLLATGFCGGFTTFSAFALENIGLLQKGSSSTAIVYTAFSIIIGLLLCKLGIWLAG
ncbi:MAG: fluoride efflux transporter CrcB [Taibaiella sp.]|nr:fluoride efflux transporter CrcB [Taibaiella sp.]